MKLNNNEIVQYQELALNVMEKSISEKRPDMSVPPKVGAVIVYQDSITKEKKVETAYRGEMRNGDHAEFTLIDRKLRNVDLTGAIMFVTLEPCAPNSRKQPKISCSERIVNARIEKVYVGIQDPYPTVNSRGLSFLESNNVKVEMFSKEYQDIITKKNIVFLEQAVNRVLDETDFYVFNETKLDKICSESSYSDLSTEALNEYATARDLKLDVQSDAFKDHLTKIGLIQKSDKDGTYSLTYACVLLFGNEPEMFIPGTSVICKNMQFESQIVTTIRGPLVLIPKKIEEWYRLNSLVSYSRESVVAKEIYIIPLEIFREGIINALVHRNYELTAANIQIDVSSTGVVISSPGLPSSPITLEKLQSFTAPSFSRYPRLTYIFSAMKLMERANIGLASIKKSSEIIDAQYTFNDPMLVLRLVSLVKSSETSRTTSPKVVQKKSDYFAIPDELQAFLDNLDVEENNQIKMIITLVANKGPISKKDIVKSLNINEKNVQRILNEYVDKEILTVTGNTRNRRFSINHTIKE
jgi:ATP-dependent DNA helicase RecG